MKKSTPESRDARLVLPAGPPATTSPGSSPKPALPCPATTPGLCSWLAGEGGVPGSRRPRCALGRGEERLSRAEEKQAAVAESPFIAVTSAGDSPC